MLILFKIICFFIFLVFAGFIIWEVFFCHLKRINIFYIALFFGLGAGFISLEMFLIAILGYHFNLFTIILPWIILLSIVIYQRRKILIKYKIEKFNFHFSGFQYLVLALIIFIALINFLNLFSKPVLGLDPLVNWNHKAKIFYIDQTIDFNIFSDKLSLFFHREYPLTLPLIETLFYNFLGAFDDQLVKIIFFVFYLCLLAVLYNFIKLLTNKTTALTGIFFLSSIPFLSENVSGYYSGNADVIYSYFNFISIGYLLLWLIKEKEKKFFYISCIFAGLAFWTKLEGIILIIANLLTLCYHSFIFKRKLKFKQLFLYALVAVALASPWLFMVMLYNLDLEYAPQENLLSSLNARLIKAPQVIKYAVGLKLNWKEWNIFWPLFYISFILFMFYRHSQFLSIFYLNFFLQLGMYFMTIIFNREAAFSLSISALERLLWQITPLAMLVFCENLSSRIKDKKEIVDSYSTKSSWQVFPFAPWWKMPTDGSNIRLAASFASTRWRVFVKKRFNLFPPDRGLN